MKMKQSKTLLEVLTLKGSKTHKSVSPAQTRQPFPAHTEYLAVQVGPTEFLFSLSSF